MKNKAYIWYMIVAVMNYISAALNFFVEKEIIQGITFLCMGSAFLCLGAADMNRQNKEKDENDK